jgi:hypothetical protein
MRTTKTVVNGAEQTLSASTPCDSLPVDTSAGSWESRLDTSNCLEGMDAPAVYLIPNCDDSGCAPLRIFLGQCLLVGVEITSGEQPKSFKTFCSTKYVRGSNEGEVKLTLTVSDLFGRNDLRRLLYTPVSQFTQNGQTLTREKEVVAQGSPYQSFTLVLLHSGKSTDIRRALVLTDAVCVGYDTLSYSPEDVASVELMFKYSNTEYYS